MSLGIEYMYNGKQTFCKCAIWHMPANLFFECEKRHWSIFYTTKDTIRLIKFKGLKNDVRYYFSKGDDNYSFYTF